MNRDSLISFFAIMFTFVLAVAGHNFVRYYIAKDYPLHVFVQCDPAHYNCFTADPATADPTFQTGPYAKVEINAAYAPKCLDEHTCGAFSCQGLSSCSITYCSHDSLEDGESCSDGTK